MLFEPQKWVLRRKIAHGNKNYFSHASIKITSIILLISCNLSYMKNPPRNYYFSWIWEIEFFLFKKRRGKINFCIMRIFKCITVHLKLKFFLFYALLLTFIFHSYLHCSISSALCAPKKSEHSKVSKVFKWNRDWILWVCNFPIEAQKWLLLISKLYSLLFHFVVFILFNKNFMNKFFCV